jgi:hypothetical protein
MTSSQADKILEGRHDGILINVPITTVDDLVRAREIDELDLLKVDVEKAELDVLVGIGAATWNMVRQAVVEVHDIGSRVQTVGQLLERQGFRVMVDQNPALIGTGIYTMYGIHA